MGFLIYCLECPSVSITHAANMSFYEVHIHSFFKLDAGWGEWSVSLPGRLIPKQEICITPLNGRRSGTQSRFGHLKERHISCPCRESSHDSFGVHAVGRSLTDCIIAAPVCSIMDEFCKPVTCLCVIVALCVRVRVCRLYRCHDRVW